MKKKILFFLSIVLVVVVVLVFRVFNPPVEEHNDQMPESISSNPEVPEAVSAVVKKKNENLLGRSSASSSVREETSTPSRPIEFKKSSLKENAFLSDSSWKVWSGVSAFSRNQHFEAKDASDLLGELNGYSLVNDGFMADLSQFDPNHPVVLADPQFNRVGILTGTFQVILEEGANADFLTQSSEVRVVASYPESGIYFVTSSAIPFDLNEFKGDLQNAPEVKIVEVEIVFRRYEKF